MAATSLTVLRLAWDLETKLLIFLFFFLSVLPICLDPAASCVVSKRNKEGLSADTTNMNVCGDDLHDRDPVRQGHVSVSLFTPSAVARESFAGQLCLPTALTLGRFASSLCLCLNRKTRTTPKPAQSLCPAPKKNIWFWRPYPPTPKKRRKRKKRKRKKSSTKGRCQNRPLFRGRRGSGPTVAKTETPPLTQIPSRRLEQTQSSKHVSH